MSNLLDKDIAKRVLRQAKEYNLRKHAQALENRPAESHDDSPADAVAAAPGQEPALKSGGPNKQTPEPPIDF